jgi:uncharacterized protein
LITITKEATMQKTLLTLLLLYPLAADAQHRQAKEPVKVTSAVKEPEYQMKEYYFVMLRKGAGREKIIDTAVINKLQTGHMANIRKMHEAGKLLVAGPFGDDGDWRGIFIIDAKDKAEVEHLLSQDPAIAAGRLDYEIHPWWTAKNSVFK